MSGVMPAEQKGAEMPREQLNTPARRVVHEFETNGKTLAAYRIMQEGDAFPTEANAHIEQEGDVFPTEANAHIELTPVVYLGWTKGKPGVYEGPPDSGHATFTIMIAEEEILREAEAIKARHEASREEALSHGASIPQGGWTSLMSEFTSVILSRQELNDFVRTSRRARNAVYGQDE